jgi:chromosome segregation ATPase
MGRPSLIGFRDVEEAVEILRAKGKPVNPYQVRAILGKGSEAKITYYLKGMGLEIEYQDEDPITKRLSNLLRPVVIELNEQYDDQIRREKADLQECISRLTEKSRQDEEKIRTLEDELDRVNAWAAELERLNKEQNAELDNERKTITSQDHQIASIEDRLASSHATIDDLKIQLQSAQSQHREVIEMLNTEHRNTLQGYKDAIEKSNQACSALNSQLADAQAVIEASTHETSVLRESINKHTIVERQLEIDLKSRERAIEKQAAEISRLENGKSALRARIRSINDALLAKHRNTIPENELRQRISALSDENARLVTEVSTLRSVIDQLKLV